MKTITREELFKFVWAEPTVKVAERLGVSDVAVSKICAKLGVPKPPRGYWARLEAGKKQPKAKLPPLRRGRMAYTEINDAVKKKAPADFVIPEFERWKAVAERLKNREHFPRPPISPDIRADLDSVRRDSQRSPFRFVISKDCASRAVRIANTITAALTACGATVGNVQGYQKDGVFRVREQEFTFELKELRKTVWVEPPPQPRPKTEADKRYHRLLGMWPGPTREYEWTGNLQMEVRGLRVSGCKRAWADSTSSLLEDRLGDALLGIAKLIALEEIEEEEARQQEIRRIEARKPRALHELRMKHLEACLVDWRRARELEEFTAAAMTHLEEVGARDDVSMEWLNWLKDVSGSLNPVKNRKLFREFSDEEIARRAKESWSITIPK